MTVEKKPASHGIAAAALGRGALLFVLWLALAGAGVADMVPGLLAAAVATWASLKLLPPGGRGASPLLLARMAGRFVVQSVVAGIDVARRAFDPRLPLQPGFIVHPTRLPPGPALDAFRALMSLQPGTLPVSDGADGRMLVHCLDTAQPVAAQFADEEARFARLLGGEPGHG